jgi:5-formyltetrahydrofolate cyclo-ligase
VLPAHERRSDHALGIGRERLVHACHHRAPLPPLPKPSCAESGETEPDTGDNQGSQPKTLRAPRACEGGQKTVTGSAGEHIVGSNPNGSPEPGRAVTLETALGRTMTSKPPPSDAYSLAEDDLRRRVKRELRKRARGVRKALPLEACAERSALIIARLVRLSAVKSARSVALFWPITERHEVDLRALDTDLRARGVRVAYPSVVPDVVPRAMTFHFVDDPSELLERGYGFAEPSRDAHEVSKDLHELDVVVVPALALDPTGHRIGYGAGYYDGALTGTAVTKIGVIFDFQLVSEVPATDGDVPVDWVVTDRRVMDTHEPNAADTPPDVAVTTEKEAAWPT